MCVDFGDADVAVRTNYVHSFLVCRFPTLPLYVFPPFVCKIWNQSGEVLSSLWLATPTQYTATWVNREATYLWYMKKITMMMAVKSWTMACLVAAAILFLIARQAGECSDCTSLLYHSIHGTRLWFRFSSSRFCCYKVEGEHAWPDRTSTAVYIFYYCISLLLLIFNSHLSYSYLSLIIMRLYILPLTHFLYRLQIHL